MACSWTHPLFPGATFPPGDIERTMAGTAEPSFSRQLHPPHSCPAPLMSADSTALNDRTRTEGKILTLQNQPPFLRSLLRVFMDRAGFPPHSCQSCFEPRYSWPFIRAPSLIISGDTPSAIISWRARMAAPIIQRLGRCSAGSLGYLGFALPIAKNTFPHIFCVFQGWIQVNPGPFFFSLRAGGKNPLISVDLLVFSGSIGFQWIHHHWSPCPGFLVYSWIFILPMDF